MGRGHRAACGGSGDQAGADRSALASVAGTAAAGRAGPGAFLGADPAVHHGRGVGLGGADRPSRAASCPRPSRRRPLGRPGLATPPWPPAQHSLTVTPPCPLRVPSPPRPPRPSPLPHGPA